MPINQPHPAIFYDDEDMECWHRDWGKEIVKIETEHFTIKQIEMKPGAAGGLQYHHEKDEVGEVLEGHGVCEYDPGDGNLHMRSLRPGDKFRFPAGAVHRITAGLENGLVYEVVLPINLMM